MKSKSKLRLVQLENLFRRSSLVKVRFSTIHPSHRVVTFCFENNKKRTELVHTKDYSLLEFRFGTKKVTWETSEEKDSEIN